ncbi:hypothetical protein Dimus_000565 [Dionaea muscipula]
MKCCRSTARCITQLSLHCSLHNAAAARRRRLRLTARLLSKKGVAASAARPRAPCPLLTDWALAARHSPRGSVARRVLLVIGHCCSLRGMLHTCGQLGGQWP